MTGNLEWPWQYTTWATFETWQPLTLGNLCSPGQPLTPFATMFGNSWEYAGINVWNMSEGYLKNVRHTTNNNFSMAVTIG